MEKEFVPYNLALELKELGFDEPCFATWNGGTLDMSLQIPSDDYFTKAPTFSQCFRWFRENNIDHSIVPMRVDGWHMYQYVIFTLDEVVETGFDTYEEAELACLTKLIEIVKTK